jgi:hypothetical protein
MERNENNISAIVNSANTGFGRLQLIVPIALSVASEPSKLGRFGLESSAVPSGPRECGVLPDTPSFISRPFQPVRGSALLRGRHDKE